MTSRRSTERRRLAAVLLPVAAVLLFGVVYLVLGAGSGAEQNVEAGLDQNPTAASRLSQSRLAWARLVRKGLPEARRLNLLGRWPFSSLKAPAGVMPRRLRSEVKAFLLGSEPLRLRFGEARYGTAPSGVGLWAVPGKGVICAFRADTFASTCTTVLRAHREGVVLQTYKAGKRSGSSPPLFTALGLVPDAVAAVKVKVGSMLRDVPVSHNVFAAEGRQPVLVARLVR